MTSSLFRRLLTVLIAVTLCAIAMPARAEGRGEPPPGVSMEVKVVGEAKLGHSLGVIWDIQGGSGAGIYYEWFCDGVRMRETSASFRFDDLTCLGKNVTVQVTLDHFSDNWTIVRTPPAVGPVTTGPVVVGVHIPGDRGIHRAGEKLWARVQTTPAEAEHGYQWLLDGKVIPGATSISFTPPRAMLGRRLSVTVSAKAEVWEKGVETSEPTNPLKPGWLADGVEIAGVAEVGREVSTGPTGIGDLNSVTYAWSVDGVVISGSIEPSLTLRADMAGRQLRSILTLKGLGRTEVLTSAPLLVRNGKLASEKPQLVGSATVGWVLEVRAPRWTTTPTRVTHQWFRTDANGVASKVAGATSTRYRVTPADQGRSFFAEIAATAPGMEPALVRSAPTSPVAFSVYTTPGEHTVNGRKWRTSCEPYSQTSRCRTEIWATQVTGDYGRFVTTTGWVFNNLTYLASPRPMWKGNPLASNQHWEDTGRRWYSLCDTPETGRNACRVYIESSTIAQSGGAYHWQTGFVFNNVVHFG